MKITIKIVYSLLSLPRLLTATTVNNTADITVRTVGALNTLDFQLYFERNGRVISAFHDIPLFANEEKTLYNMVVEIPRWTITKNEINKETPLNPIKQDYLNGKARFLPNIFPYKGYIWNYGAFPQTWEDPSYISPYTGKKGDNDPIDVCEIGQSIGHVGQIKQVKILGMVGLIDQEEMDWKVIVIDVMDPLFDKLNDINDMETYMPGLLNTTNALFKIYKIPSGRPENSIAFDGVVQNKEFATKVVLETREHWERLINGTTPRDFIETINLSVKDSPYRVGYDNGTVRSIPKNYPQPPAIIDEIYDKSFFISPSIMSQL